MFDPALPPLKAIRTVGHFSAESTHESSALSVCVCGLLFTDMCNEVWNMYSTCTVRVWGFYQRRMCQCEECFVFLEADRIH